MASTTTSDQSRNNESPFADISKAPPDPILGIKQKANADPNPRKVDLSVGIYQDDEGKTANLAVVCEAQERLLKLAENAGYLPIDGHPGFIAKVKALVFGADSAVVKEKRVAVVQSIGGTSALRYGADFLRRYYPQSAVYISDPSWENHRAVFQHAGFRVETYPYYNSSTRSVDFKAMLNKIGSLPPGSIVLLHGCCHNPTGMDLTAAEWDDLVDVFCGGCLVPFIDFAYQGFGQGIEEDALAVRKFAAAGLSFLAATSYSKNFALYRRRLGALSVVCGSAEEAERVLSQLKIDIRTNNSNPPVDGAAIVDFILSDEDLRCRWEEECAAMRRRIQLMRGELISLLAKRGLGERFSALASQTGMFSYSGLSREEVQQLEEKFSIYAVASGRICVAALNSRNIEYVADAIAAVSKG